MIKILALLLVSTLAHADIYTRNLLPFGEMEAFTGNTGTGGGLLSSSAVYYNPAVLTQIEEPRLAVSATSYVQSVISAEYTFSKDFNNLPFRVSSFQSVPGTVASVFHGKDFTWAYFILVPESLQSDAQFSFGSSETEISSFSKQSANDIWGGLSGAIPLSENFSLGATFFAARHELSLINTQNVSFKTKPNTAAFSQSYFSGSSIEVSCILGLSYRLASWANLGLRVQSPFLHIIGNGSGTISVNKVENGILSQTGSHEDSLDVNYQLPLDFTLGGTFWLTDKIQVLVDTSLQTPLTYNSIEKSNQFANRQSTRLTPRFNLGGLYHLRPDFSLQGGFYAIPSAAKELSDGDSSASTFYGTTLGASYLAGRVKSSLGAFFIWSNHDSQNALYTMNLKTRVYGALLTVAYLL